MVMLACCSCCTAWWSPCLDSMISCAHAALVHYLHCGQLLVGAQVTGQPCMPAWPSGSAVTLPWHGIVCLPPQSTFGWDILREATKLEMQGARIGHVQHARDGACKGSRDDVLLLLLLMMMVYTYRTPCSPLTQRHLILRLIRSQSPWICKETSNDHDFFLIVGLLNC